MCKWSELFGGEVREGVCGGCLYYDEGVCGHAESFFVDSPMEEDQGCDLWFPKEGEVARCPCGGVACVVGHESGEQGEDEDGLTLYSDKGRTNWGCPHCQLSGPAVVDVALAVYLWNRVVEGLVQGRLPGV